MHPNVENFIGCDSSYRAASIVLYGAPYDSTTSYRPGARFGPAAIRHESYGLETYSPYQNADLTDFDVFDSGDLELCFGSSELALADIEARAEEILKDGKFPLLLGGEHLVTLGAVRAAVKKYPDLHIVHFDAHADLRDDYLGAKLSHACVLRRCHELVGDGRIHQFCIRSGDRAEFEFAAQHTEMHKFDFTGLAELTAQLCGQLGKAGKIKLVHLGVLSSKLELCPVSAADAELMDTAIPYQLVAAAQHTGVAELRAQIVVPQVGMGIEVDDVQVGVFLHRSPHRAQRDQMLAAQQQRELAVLQNFLCPGLDIGQRQLAGAEAQLQITAVEHVKIGQVGVLVGAVSLQTIALVPDSRRAEPGAGAVAGGGIVRRTVQHDAGGAVAAVAADKVLNVGVHQCSSTSRSISSRKAGR